MIKILDKISKKIALNKYNSIIESVLSMEEFYKSLTNDELKNAFKSLKSNDFSNKKDALSILSELSFRFLGLRPFKSQLKGSLILNDGMIAEMKTGEGKTLVTILALMLNYLSNKNAHIVTANEYLVKRDYNFSKKLFEFLEISSDYMHEEQTVNDKINAYKMDVVYATSKDLVFDYLNNNRFRDPKILYDERRDFIIVDEVDFVLIDEARTPIILSGILETDKELYRSLQEIQNDFIGINKVKDEGETIKNPDFIYTQDFIELTEKGYNELELKLIEKGFIKEKGELYDGSGFKYIKSMERALKANYILKKDVHYVVRDDQVLIINTQTGRIQAGRRFSDGLHQAIEAKESVSINDDAQSLAQTTLQNYFKKYKKISGTTGTAKTEENELREFYSMKVLEVETNKPLIRLDGEDLLFLNKSAMKKNILIDLKENILKGRPTLIGVQSVADSEDVANFLRSENIEFEVLDAKNHEKEAYVIEKAGMKSSVTIATNMAGRGTDIMLGGNKEPFIKKIIELNPSITLYEAERKWEEAHEEVVKSGGLSVIGIGRSESRRLDNQLIGRSGRQGDPGMSRYYINLEDSIFANVSTSYLKNQWSKGNESHPISASIISKIVRESQKTSESAGFNMRKNLLRFDNINTEQREIFYNWRRNVVMTTERDKLFNVISKYFKDTTLNMVLENLPIEDFLSNEMNKLEKELENTFGLEIDIKKFSKDSKVYNKEILIEKISEVLISRYKEKSDLISKADMIQIEKDLLLKIMDRNWSENISGLEEMRISTSLRSYAQKNPLDEYQKEALSMFSNLTKDIKKDYCIVLSQFSPLALLKNIEESKINKEDDAEDNANVNTTTKIDESKLSSFPSYIEGIGI